VPEAVLVSLDAGSDLLRAGLERVAIRAGLEVAREGQPGAILLRVQRSEGDAQPAIEGDPAEGFDVELIVIGEQVKIRARMPLGNQISAAVKRLLHELGC
jgi:hypothetical protein